jgi:hypothetical protein
MSLLFKAACAVTAATCLALPSVATADILSGPVPHFSQYGQTLFGGDDPAGRADLPFAFSFYGQSYSAVNISANGFVTFTSSGELDIGVADWAPTGSGLVTGPARIAPLWFDRVGYVMADKSQAGRYTITWLSEEYGQTGIFLTQLSLFSDGHFSFAYGEGAPQGVSLAGISAGGGVPNPGPLEFDGADYSTNARTIYDLYGPGEFNSSVGVTFTPEGPNFYHVVAGLAPLAAPPPLPEWPAEEPGGVPEPASWALMILGFGAAGATLRRRRLAI